MGRMILASFVQSSHLSNLLDVEKVTIDPSHLKSYPLKRYTSERKEETYIASLFDE